MNSVGICKIVDLDEILDPAILKEKIAGFTSHSWLIQTLDQDRL